RAVLGVVGLRIVLLLQQLPGVLEFHAPQDGGRGGASTDLHAARPGIHAPGDSSMSRSAAGRDPRRLTRWWRRRSLRTRLTVIAATAIAVSVFGAFQVASELLDWELRDTAEN